MLDTFNKAGTFGYAYALLPLLTCRSRVGQQKKNTTIYYLCIILAIVLTTACSEMITITKDRERSDLELMPREPEMSGPEPILTAILGKNQGKSWESLA